MQRSINNLVRSQINYAADLARRNARELQNTIRRMSGRGVSSANGPGKANVENYAGLTLVGSRGGQSPLTKAVTAVVQNQNIPAHTLDQLSLFELNRVAERRVELASERARGRMYERTVAEQLQRDLNLARSMIEIGLGVVGFEAVLLIFEGMTPAPTVGEILIDILELLVEYGNPTRERDEFDLASEHVKLGLRLMRKVAGSRVP
jgi:hypothetical protein